MEKLTLIHFLVYKVLHHRPRVMDKKKPFILGVMGVQNEGQERRKNVLVCINYYIKL